MLRSLPCMENSELVMALLSNSSHGQRQHYMILTDDMPRKDMPIQSATSHMPSIVFPILSSSPPYGEVTDNFSGRSKLNNFDLNDEYVDSDDGMKDVERLPARVDLGPISLEGYNENPINQVLLKQVKIQIQHLPSHLPIPVGMLMYI